MMMLFPIPIALPLAIIGKLLFAMQNNLRCGVCYAILILSWRLAQTGVLI